MARFILRRLLLALITLWILVTIVFVIVAVLPSDIGRTILGPFAPAESVAQLNHKLGTDRPMLTQYVDSIKHVVTFQFGDSYQLNKPVTGLVLTALGRSAKLAVLALVMTVPLAILAGMFAARRRDRLIDRLIVVLGLASSSIPEFVTGTILVVVVGVKLGWLPVLAQAPDGAGFFEGLRYLLLPSLSLVIVYFGYIARMARAGTIAALASDYTRTAVMKGLTPSRVLFRHVTRNALVPTVAVVGVQVGYLFGGLIGVERIFNYSGLGATILSAVKAKDVPVLQASVLVIGIVYMVATLAADLVISWMNPRARIGGAS
jgi:peptide/nickel transport system permease protein